MTINAQLSHLAFRAAEPDALARFYERVVGLVASEPAGDGPWTLGWGQGHHVLEIASGEGPACVDHLALEVPDPQDLAALEQRLAAAGVPATWTQPPGDHPPALRIADPDGNGIELHGRVDRSGEHAADPGRRPVRIHHVTFASPQVAEMERFYVEQLGFRVSDRMGDVFTWLRCNREHHTVAIVAATEAGLDHYAYELDSWEDFKIWSDELAVRGVPVTWGPGRHGPGNNLFLFFDDAAGFRVELSAELERYWDERAACVPREWTPSDLTVNLWGPPPPWRTQGAATRV